MNRVLRISLSAGLATVLSFLLYTLSHEGGHAIVGILCGGKIQRFVLGINPHVEIINANFSKITASLMHLMGSVLPMILTCTLIFFYNENKQNIIYHLFHFVFSYAVAFSLLSWVIIPIISLCGKAPINDDVTKFMQTSNVHPIIISLTSILLMYLLIQLIKKRIFFSKLLDS